jgi:hypothetical protein
VWLLLFELQSSWCGCYCLNYVVVIFAKTVLKKVREDFGRLPSFIPGILPYAHLNFLLFCDKGVSPTNIKT